MKTNILFFGNCQARSLLETLQLPEEYNVRFIPCWNTDIDKFKKEDFIKIIKDTNIIITQPIRDNYRDVDYLSTSFLLKTKSANCKVIILPSCNFSFYHFDVRNLGSPDPITVYHYKNMVECIKAGHTEEYFISNFVENVDLKTSSELETIANDGLNRLRERFRASKDHYGNQDVENIHFIPIHDFIEENYRDKLLFYTPNHPTKHITQEVCKRILDILQIPATIDYDIDTNSNPKLLMYKCIQKNLNFNIEYETISLGSIRNDIPKFIKLYFDNYKIHGLPEWPDRPE